MCVAWRLQDSAQAAASDSYRKSRGFDLRVLVEFSDSDVKLGNAIVLERRRFGLGGPDSEKARFQASHSRTPMAIQPTRPGQVSDGQGYKHCHRVSWEIAVNRGNLK